MPHSHHIPPDGAHPLDRLVCIVGIKKASLHSVGGHPTGMKFVTDRVNKASLVAWRASLFGALSVSLGCSNQLGTLEAELFPETQLPHFKTCAARVEGTYQERKLQQHLVVDIYREPAPDQGPMTAECIIRE